MSNCIPSWSLWVIVPVLLISAVWIMFLQHLVDKYKKEVKDE